MCNLANCSKSEEGDFERAFARIKQMNDIDYDKHWEKSPPWKQGKYDFDEKSHIALYKLKGTFRVTSRGEWQLDYKIPSQLRQYQVDWSCLKPRDANVNSLVTFAFHGKVNFYAVFNNINI